jgi:Cache sensor signal transduction histidine kinase (EC 2.7.3.-)
MADFTIDLLRSYDKQYQDYRQEISGDLENELASQAFAALKAKIKNKRVGKTGYIYCIDRSGTLKIHPEAEGRTIIDAKDSDGNPFIREMVENKSGWIRYPWENVGDQKPRMKIVRYEYFPTWDWIVAVGSYEDEFYKEANAIKSHIFLSTLCADRCGRASLATLFVFYASTRGQPTRSPIIDRDPSARLKRGRYCRHGLEVGRAVTKLAEDCHRL